MKTKIIPFNLEMAEKIQAGEIEGKIVRRGAQNQVCEILEFYAEWQTHCDEKFLIVKVPVHDFERERLWIYHQDGRAHHHNACTEMWYDLVLEVPYKEIQGELKQNFETVAESDAYAEGYKNGFKAGRCVAFDDNKGMMLKTHVSQFKPFDKVLVRYPDKTELCAPNSAWLPGIFQYKSVNSNLYFVSGKAYKDCIPYEGNEHLVGTTDKQKEE